MLRLTKNLTMKMSIKNKLARAVTQFLTIDTGGVLRNTPTTKQRKYKNIQITQDFKKLDTKRKKQRFEHMKKRQFLIEQKLKSETKLLGGPATQEQLKTQLATLQQSISKYSQQIAQLDQLINQSEADYMVVEGFMKVVVTNHIKYLEYLNRHNAGSTLHPQTIKSIQNIHYCVNHNLPVNRIRLYEIMPQYFEAEIGELEQSVRKLIEQKQIFIQDEQSQSSVRFFYKSKIRNNDPTDPTPLQVHKNQVFDNLFDYCNEKLSEHTELIQNVVQGKTPFRNLDHMITVMLSDMPIKYLPQEQALRKVLVQIVQLEKEWQNFSKQIQKQIQKLATTYIQPPPYIKNHPVLLQRYNKVMQKLTNPIPFNQSQFVVQGDKTQQRIFKKIQQQIRTVVKQKYDPIFIEAMNNDRSLIDKKKLEIEFYNLSTKTMQNILALEDHSTQQQQIFQKLPKQAPLFLTQRKKNQIPLQYLTRMLFLNSQDKIKYNLQFFSEWFGIDKSQLQSALKYVSYLRVPVQKTKQKQEDIKTQILKFQL